MVKACSKISSGGTGRLQQIKKNMEAKKFDLGYKIFRPSVDFFKKAESLDDVRKMLPPQWVLKTKSFFTKLVTDSAFCQAQRSEGYNLVINNHGEQDLSYLVNRACGGSANEVTADFRIGMRQALDELLKK